MRQSKNYSDCPCARHFRQQRRTAYNLAFRSQCANINGYNAQWVLNLVQLHGSPDKEYAQLSSGSLFSTWVSEYTCTSSQSFVLNTAATVSVAIVILCEIKLSNAHISQVAPDLWWSNQDFHLNYTVVRAPILCVLLESIWPLGALLRPKENWMRKLCQTVLLTFCIIAQLSNFVKCLFSTSTA